MMCRVNSNNTLSSLSCANGNAAIRRGARFRKKKIISFNSTFVIVRIMKETHLFKEVSEVQSEVQS